MATNNSTMPYIKNEPDDSQFNPNQYMASSNGPSFQNQAHQFGSWQGSMGNVDPSELSMNGNAMQNAMQPSFGSQQNLSSSYIAGGLAVGDDELEDLINLPDTANSNIPLHQNQNGGFQNRGTSGFNNNHFTGIQNASAPVTAAQNQYINAMYSNTPDGYPIQSPFLNQQQPSNFSPWVTQNQNQNNFNNSLPVSANVARHGSQDLGMRAAFRAERNSTDSMSPMTPKTRLANLQLGTPDSMSFSGTANQMNRRHQKSTSGQWESPVSGNSYADSPISSPQNGLMHPQISEVAKAGVKPHSLPTKVEHGFNSAPASTLEAKRQKRRQSHNAVERRRRDNINDRIGVLSQLVPPHRLDDDKIRKQLTNNASHPQGLGGASISPPQATSLLAGGQGRRATGGITQGLPIDDKDKGPAKGDVLAGAVSWTRDLMWLLQRKLQHEAMVSELLDSLGAQVPYEIFDDEWRMRRELQDSIDRNGADNFTYSRADGSGLWVPGYTDQAGNSMQGGVDENGFNNSLDQDDGMPRTPTPNDYWNFDNDASTNRGSLELKEEDEFGMDLN